jgi:hypothetical protein
MRIYLAMGGPAAFSHGNGWPYQRAPQTYAEARPHRNHLRMYDTPPLYFRMLMSFYYFNRPDIDEVFAEYFPRPYPEVFADSGAFSAYTKNQTIDVAAYADWLHRYKHLFSAYATLDVIGDAKASLKNQAYLEKRGLNPLPIFHTGDPWSLFDDFIKDYPYIGLSGVGDFASAANKKFIALLVRCFERSNGKTVFHGFGHTSWPVLSSFPWYSVDSSSWHSGIRYGRILYFDKLAQKLMAVDAKRSEYVSIVKGLRQHIERAGCSVPALLNNHLPPERNINLGTLGALAYMEAERYLTERWGDFPIPNRDVIPNVSTEQRVSV